MVSPPRGQYDLGGKNVGSPVPRSDNSIPGRSRQNPIVPVNPAAPGKKESQPGGWLSRHIDRDYTSLDLAHVLGSRALATLSDYKFDPITLMESTETRPFDLRVVDKNVIPVVTFDEAISLAVIEPFDSTRFTLTHRYSSCETWPHSPEQKPPERFRLSRR
jgi:hypothetical protein